MTDEITLDAPETPLERFLAAAAGMDGITLDEPVTRIEKYLYKIAQNAGGELPPITAADDGKVLTANSGVWGAQEPYFTFVLRYNDVEDEITADNIDSAEYERAIENNARFVAVFYYSQTSMIADVTRIGAILWDIDVYYLNIVIGEKVRHLILTPSRGGSEYREVAVNDYNLLNDNRFIVTLTPTAADYSGTMDKTVAEIDAAYKAGQEILFKVILSATDYIEGALTAVRHFGSYSYDDYFGNIVLPSEGMLVTVETLGTDDGTKQTYSTHVYHLTPAT